MDASSWTVVAGCLSETASSSRCRSSGGNGGRRPRPWRLRGAPGAPTRPGSRRTGPAGRGRRTDAPGTGAGREAATYPATDRNSRRSASASTASTRYSVKGRLSSRSTPTYRVRPANARPRSEHVGHQRVGGDQRHTAAGEAEPRSRRPATAASQRWRPSSPRSTGSQSGSYDRPGIIPVSGSSPPPLRRSTRRRRHFPACQPVGAVPAPAALAAQPGEGYPLAGAGCSGRQGPPGRVAYTRGVARRIAAGHGNPACHAAPAPAACLRRMPGCRDPRVRPAPEQPGRWRCPGRRFPPT